MLKRAGRTRPSKASTCAYSHCRGGLDIVHRLVVASDEWVEVRSGGMTNPPVLMFHPCGRQKSGRTSSPNRTSSYVVSFFMV
jgi:hypothetical protein